MLDKFTISTESANRLLDVVLGVIPSLVLAIIVFVVGWVIAWFVQRGVVTVFNKAKFIDDAFRGVGFEEVTRRAGMSINIGKFFGVIIKVFIILLSLVLSLDILGFNQINDFFINRVLAYIPNVISAAIIITIGVLLANFVAKVIMSASKAASVSSGFASALSKYSIIVFTVFVALGELGVATQIINTIIGGVITAISIAIGLAFGLGGQEVASDTLKKIREEMKNR